MKSITELRDKLGNVFDNLESGKLKVPVAKEMNNSAGKIIGTVKVQLEAAALRKESPNIAFLQETA